MVHAVNKLYSFAEYFYIHGLSAKQRWEGGQQSAGFTATWILEDEQDFWPLITCRSFKTVNIA